MPDRPARGAIATRCGAALEAAVDRRLPSGTTIRAVPPAHMLATKIEAYLGRGEDDFLGSRDFGDVIALVDGRAELVDEVREAPSDLRAYLADRLRRMQHDFRFDGAVAGSLMPDPASQARAAIVRDRIQQIIDADP